LLFFARINAEMNATSNLRARRLGASIICFLIAASSASRAEVPSAGKSYTPVQSCAELAKHVMPHAAITAAESVAAGDYHAPAGMRFPNSPGLSVVGKPSIAPNPAFCRIAATLKPSNDSDIKIEVWLPQSNWNGKFLGVANFGVAGSLMYDGMQTGLAEGYATASTDTGHDNSPGSAGGRFALGHPEKLIDYAYRATHAMTVDAKSLIKAFYGSGPVYSYMVGCSLGGLEGLIEAKRYPADYNGIVSGAPPNPIINFNAVQLWPTWLINQDPKRMIPKEKYAMLHQAALKACGSPVGLKQGLVEAPDQCQFDPVVLQCKADDAPDCLTAPQVYLMQQIYAGAVNPRTKEKIFPGPARGAELEMPNMAGTNPQPLALGMFQYMALQNPDWSLKDMDFDKAVSEATEKIGPLMHVDANLKPFFDHGGKLLLYVGWEDYHNAVQLMDYYKQVVKNSGTDPQHAAVQLFPVPGMGHCGGGPGCDAFDKLGIIDRWVDDGTAPERIVASRYVDGKVVRTRPLCAYPALAVYNGTGDTENETSFKCVKS
jgi:feruloyl esterase